MAKKSYAEILAELKKLKSKAKSLTTSTEQKTKLGIAVECLPEAKSNPDGFRPASVRFGRDSGNGGMLLLTVWKFGKPINVNVRIADVGLFTKNVMSVKHVEYVKKD